MNKTCKKCGKEKPFLEFYKSKGYFQNVCRKCQHLRTIEWRKENRDWNNETKRKWYLKNVERCRFLQKICSQKSFKRNPQKFYDRKKRWLEKNPHWEKEFYRTRRNKLENTYLKDKIKRQTGLLFNEINDQILWAKYNQIMAIREVNKIKRRLKDEGVEI